MIEVSKWLLLGIAEVYLLMLLVGGFLVFNISRFKTMVRALQAKIKGLTQALTEAKQNNETLSNKVSYSLAYPDQLEQQLEFTNAYHLELPGDDPIESYLTPEHPIERQTLALRHAVLTAELDAVVKDSSRPNWADLQAGLAVILSKYSSKLKARLPGSNSTKVEGDCAKVFEDLCAELSKHKRLPDNVELLLERAKAALNRASEPDGLSSSGSENIDAAQDLASLRALADKQEKTIIQLQRRLAEGKGQITSQLVDEVNQELVRQRQYLQESEACVNQLEEELDAAGAKIEELEQSVKVARQSVDRQELIKQNTTLKQKLRQQSAEIDQLLQQLNISDP